MTVSFSVSLSLFVRLMSLSFCWFFFSVYFPFLSLFLYFLVSLLSLFSLSLSSVLHVISKIYSPAFYLSFLSVSSRSPFLPLPFSSLRIPSISLLPFSSPSPSHLPFPIHLYSSPILLSFFTPYILGHPFLFFLS